MLIFTDYHFSLYFFDSFSMMKKDADFQDFFSKSVYQPKEWYLQVIFVQTTFWFRAFCDFRAFHSAFVKKIVLIIRIHL